MMNKKILILGLVVLVALFMFSIVSVEAGTFTNTTCVFRVLGGVTTQVGRCDGIREVNQTQQVNIKVNYTMSSGAVSNYTARVRMAIINSNGTAIVNKTGNLTSQNSSTLRLRNTSAADRNYEINYTLNLTSVLPGNFTFIFGNGTGVNATRKFNFTLKDVKKPSVRKIVERPTGGPGTVQEIRLRVEDTFGGIVSKVYVNLTSLTGTKISPRRINLTTNNHTQNGTWAVNFTLPANLTNAINFTVYVNDSRGVTGRYGNTTYNTNKSFSFLYTVPVISNTTTVCKSKIGSSTVIGTTRIGNISSKINCKVNVSQNPVNNSRLTIRMALRDPSPDVDFNKTNNLTGTLTVINITGGMKYGVNFTYNSSNKPGNYSFFINGTDGGNNTVKERFNFSISDVVKPSVIDLIESPNGTSAGGIAEIRLEVLDDVNVSRVWANLTIGGSPISPKRINLTTNGAGARRNYSVNFTLPINVTTKITFTVYINDTKNYNGSSNRNSSYSFSYDPPGPAGLTSLGSGGGGGGSGRSSRFDPRYMSAYTVHCVQGDCAGYSYVEDSSPAVVVEDVEIRPVVTTPKPTTPKTTPSQSSVKEDKEDTGDLDELAAKDLAEETTDTGAEVKSDNTTLWVVIIVIIVLGLLAWWWFAARKKK